MAKPNQVIQHPNIKEAAARFDPGRQKHKREQQLKLFVPRLVGTMCCRSGSVLARWL
jgi:hypothetical protein